MTDHLASDSDPATQRDSDRGRIDLSSDIQRMFDKQFWQLAIGFTAIAAIMIAVLRLT